MTTGQKRFLQISFFVFVTCMVLLLFHRFTQQNNERIQEQNRVYAEDAARQTAMRINDQFNFSLSLIVRYAHFASFSMENGLVTRQMLRDIEESSPFNAVRFSDALGINHAPDGEKNDVSDLEFFKQGIQGKSGVSVVENSGLFHQTVLGFYAPLVRNGKILGVLRGTYLADSHLRTLLKTTYFGHPSHVYLCAANGTIIANSSDKTYTENVFQILLNDGLITPQTALVGQQLLDKGESGSIISETAESEANISIMRLPTFDFFLVQTFPAAVTSAMVKNANMAGIQLEISLLALSALVALFLIMRERIQKRFLQRQNQLYSTIVKGMATVFSPSYYLVDVSSDNYVAIDGLNSLSKGEFKPSVSYEHMLKDYAGDLINENEKQNFFNFFSRDDLLRTLSLSDFAVYECQLMRDGKQLWENLIVACVRRQEHEPAEILFLQQDVTALKMRELQAQRKISDMNRKERQYRLAVTSNAVGAWEFNVTRDELQEGTIVQSGTRENAALGDLAPGRRVSDIFAEWNASVLPESQKEFSKIADLNYLLSCFEAGKMEIDLDYWRTDADRGEICLRQAFYMTRDDFTGDIMAMTVLRDITSQVNDQRMQTRALKNALMQAKHANEAKTTFLSNMSHHIRTPMNAIIGFATIASSHLDNRDQVRDCLQKVLSSSNHLLSLINDILDMSRIESGKMQIKDQECNISELMHNLMNIIQPQVKAKRLNMFIETFEVINEDVITDPLKLNQIFINLLGNAVKYTQMGGTISFRIEQKPAFKHGYATYIFTVEDNGIGMSQDFVSHIFEPFTREATTTKSGIQGTGLGMAITKNIVELMDGSITVESEAGKGSIFTVTLTFKLQESRADDKKLAVLEGKRALVVDDDFHICDAVDKMLKKLGMRSEWTTSGREAVYRTQIAHDDNDPYDTYILDWQMPDLDGVNTARKIRRIAGDAAPIIILTAYEWVDIEDEARDAGVNAFCAKPMFMSDLKNALIASHNISANEAETGSTKADFKGRRILLVDDLEMNREVAEFILTENGLEVETAPDGSDAVEMVGKSSENYYDAILMDVQMPTMNGYEATRSIRNLPRNDVKTMPIIAMTANAFEDDKAAALKCGMNAHISKPIDMDNFFEVLAKFLGDGHKE